MGVKRQYCGELGKRANCHAMGFLGIASRQGYIWLDRRLYMPQARVVEAASAERRCRCGVLRGVTFTTKPVLGWEMIHAARQASLLCCRSVTCTEAFGLAADLLDCSAEVDLWYLAEMPHDTGGWRHRLASDDSPSTVNWVKFRCSTWGLLKTIFYPQI